jgi:hypothetical protein
LRSLDRDPNSSEMRTSEPAVGNGGNVFAPAGPRSAAASRRVIVTTRSGSPAQRLCSRPGNPGSTPPPPSYSSTWGERECHPTGARPPPHTQWPEPTVAAAARRCALDFPGPRQVTVRGNIRCRGLPGGAVGYVMVDAFRCRPGCVGRRRDRSHGTPGAGVPDRAVRKATVVGNHGDRR